MNSKAVAGFSLFFLLGGIIGMIATVIWWGEYRAIGNWDRAPAMVTSSELRHHRYRRGDEQYNYYENIARYVYIYNNREHQGRQVGLMDKGSLADHHRRWHRTLERHRRANEPIIAWVNPDNPSQAILFREATVFHYLIVALTVASFLISCFIGLYWLWIRPPARIAGKPPWQQEGLWQDNTARYQPWDDVIKYSCVTLCTLTLVVAAAFTINKGGVDSWVKLLPWIFALAPLACLGYVSYFLALTWRYGKSHLAIQRIPIEPGSTMQAYLVSQVPLPMDSIHCTISCQRTRQEWRSNGGHNNRGGYVEVTDTIYEEEWDIPVENGGRRSQKHGWIVSISKEIPAPLPSRDIYAKEPISWTLTIRGTTPGINFHAQYPLPVFNKPGGASLPN